MEAATVILWIMFSIHLQTGLPTRAQMEDFCARSGGVKIETAVGPWRMPSGDTVTRTMYACYGYGPPTVH